MTSRASLILIAFLSASIIALPGADGGVVVLSNRTTHDVRFTISSEHSTSTEYVLQVGELATLPLFERSELSFISKVDRMQRDLMPDSVYCFQRSSDGIELSALSVPKSRRDSPEA